MQTPRLFHGTTDAAAKSIAEGDFRLDLSGSNAGKLYGAGIYLAESCSKSDEYAGENKEGLRCILLCRATLGYVNVIETDDFGVWTVVTSCTLGKYHSVLGDREKLRKTYREFIVYDQNQVYPEYVLWYKRIYK
mmetsp:Transcript_66459/g.138795  ORF Transcript_66459/g.138795 Transcript_66459/m.138795 type:complete len:134 (+) Transcript_66459:657-1058(+)